MKLFHRIEALVVVVALVLCAAGCKSTKKQTPSPYTGLMSGRGNVPPAYANVAPIPRNSNALPSAPASFNEIGGDNAFVVPGPSEATPAEADAPIVEDNALIGGEVAVAAEPAAEPAAPASTGMRKLPPVPETPAVAAGEVYVVKNGDSLSKIAAAYGVKTADIMALNPSITSADKIVVGQKITMPAGASAKAVTTSSKSSGKAAATAAPKKSNIAKESIPADGKYTVRSGDSLWIIARRFNLTSDEIRTWNNLSSDKLQVGQELMLKSAAVATPATAPAVAPAPVAAPVEAAPVASVDGATGDLAGAAVSAPVVDGAVTEPVVTEVSPQANAYPVAVMEGDTLDSMASFYDTTRETILKLNPQIQSDADLRPGMQVLIKANEQ